MQFGWFTDQRFTMDRKSGVLEPAPGWFKKGIPKVNRYADQSGAEVVFLTHEISSTVLQRVVETI